MKKIKLILLILILAFLGLVGYANQTYFLTRYAIDIDFYFVQYQLPEIFNVLYFAGCFVVGFLIAYFMSLVTRFRSNKVIRELNTTLTTHIEMISTLKSELDTLKGFTPASRPDPVVEAPPAEETTDTAEEA